MMMTQPPPYNNCKDCLLGHICMEFHGFHSTFTNIIMVLYVTFLSAMTEEGQTRIVWDSFLDKQQKLK